VLQIKKDFRLIISGSCFLQNDPVMTQKLPSF
jgi:hypothetical protein